MKLLRPFLLAACSMSLPATGLYGCSSSSSSTSGNTSSNDAAASDDAASTTTGDASPADAGPQMDATSKHDAGPVVVPACVGTGATFDHAFGTIYARVKVGAGANAQPGDFLVDFGSTGSTIDVGAFTTQPTTSCNGNVGASCTFADFDFFGSWGQVTFTNEDYSGLKGSPRQAGIIGTDFLFVHPFTADYAGNQLYQGSNTAFCSDAVLTAAGYAPMTTAGFYSSNLGSLNPLSTVDSAAGSGKTVPNVPTVKMKVGGVSALTELDTGFDDAVVPFSINVNEAYLAAIQAANPSALTRDASLDLTLSTCAGVSESVDAYKVTGTADLVADDLTAARSETGAVLFVKHTPAAAKYCGGIGTWTVPAAQIGSSFFESARVVIFDPIHTRVWMPRN